VDKVFVLSTWISLGAFALAAAGFGLMLSLPDYRTHILAACSLLLLFILLQTLFAWVHILAEPGQAANKLAWSALFLLAGPFAAYLYLFRKSKADPGRGPP
jgi:hypothetical protein